MPKTAKLALAALALLIWPPTLGAQQQPPPGATPATERIGPQPVQVFEHTVYDAGEVDPGSVMRHGFVVRNEGDAPLEIVKVQPGCGCSVAQFDQVVPPGESSLITILVKVYPEWAGRPVRKTAWVVTNDPLAPQTRLVMEGRVKPTRRPVTPSAPESSGAPAG